MYEQYKKEISGFNMKLDKDNLVILNQSIRNDLHNLLGALNVDIYKQKIDDLIKQSYLNCIDVEIEELQKDLKNTFSLGDYQKGIEEYIETRIWYLQEERKKIENHE